MILLLMFVNAYDFSNAFLWIILYPMMTVFMVMGSTSLNSLEVFSNDVLIQVPVVIIFVVGILITLYVSILGWLEREERRKDFLKKMKRIIKQFEGEKISIRKMAKIARVEYALIERWLLELPEKYPIKRVKQSITIKANSVDEQLLADLDQKFSDWERGAKKL